MDLAIQAEVKLKHKGWRCRDGERSEMMMARLKGDQGLSLTECYLFF